MIYRYSFRSLLLDLLRPETDYLLRIELDQPPLAGMVPALANARISRVWGGLLDMTPDALPIIKRVAEVEGLIVAAGFSGHGFCLGPVTGEIVRDLAFDGDTTYPIEQFRLDRFAGQSGDHNAVAPTLHG